MGEEKGKITFGFSKTVDKRSLIDSVIRDEASKDVEKDTDYVLSIDGKRIKSTVGDDGNKKKELVIPLIAKNNWRLPSTAAGSKVKGEVVGNDLDSQAIREILDDVRRINAGEDETNDVEDANMVIPMYMQNKVPEGFETDEKLNVALRADESTLDDYDSIPIDQFGLAMLRGMGWQPGKGIGAKNKREVAPCEVVLRPKGLGLGANPRLKMNKAGVKKAEDKESKALIVGAYVKILSGIHKGLYGQVQGLDFDNARVMIKLTLSSENVTISELYVEVVSKNEYKKESKLINKEKYDEYKAKEDQKQRNGIVEEERRSESKSKSRSYEESSRHHKRKHSPDSKKHSSKHKKEEKSRSSWVYPMLRVRFIEKKYKNGQFYNTKIIIDDVVNKDLCICRTDSGKILEDIPQDWLETLIPKTSPAFVMVVQGSNKGQIGEVLDRNKKKCIATVQLLQEKNLIQVDYDSICEYAVDREGDCMAVQNSTATI